MDIINFSICPISLTNCIGEINKDIKKIKKFSLKKRPQFVIFLYDEENKPTLDYIYAENLYELSELLYIRQLCLIRIEVVEKSTINVYGWALKFIEDEIIDITKQYGLTINNLNSSTI